MKTTAMPKKKKRLSLVGGTTTPHVSDIVNHELCNDRAVVAQQGEGNVMKAIGCRTHKEETAMDWQSGTEVLGLGVTRKDIPGGHRVSSEKEGR